MKGIKDTRTVRNKMGERLREARGQMKRPELVQRLKESPKAPLESKAEMNPERLKQWEYGNNPISHEWIPAICEVLECDVGYLFGEYKEKRREVSDTCKVTGLSERAIVCLQKVNPIAAWRNPLRRGSTSSDSVFVKMPYIEKTLNLLDNLITSEHFLNMFGEIGLYLIDAGELPDGFINKSRIDLTEYEAEKFNDWMDWQNKVPYNRKDVAEMHLQLACDELKAIYRNVLADRLEMRGKNG